MAQAHDLTLEGSIENGIGEWACYTCGRRILVKLDPFNKVVIVAGDELVNHVSIIDNKRIVNVAVTGAASVGSDVKVETDTDWLADNGIDWGDDGPFERG